MPGEGTPCACTLTAACCPLWTWAEPALADAAQSRPASTAAAATSEDAISNLSAMRSLIGPLLSNADLVHAPSLFDLGFGHSGRTPPGVASPRSPSRRRGGAQRRPRGP